MRVALFCLGLAGAIVVSPWVAVVCMVVASLRYRAWEVMVLGLTIDFLWQPTGWYVPYFTLMSILIVWVCEPLRERTLV